MYERASYSSNESVNELKENMMRRISWLLQIVSFDNKGEFIIRDSLSRGPDLYVKKEINLNESYFNNPEQAKNKIERKKELSNTDRLSATAKDTLVSPLKRFAEKMLDSRNVDFSNWTRIAVRNGSLSAKIQYTNDMFIAAPTWLSEQMIYRDFFDAAKSLNFDINEEIGLYKWKYMYEKVNIINVDLTNNEVDIEVEMGIPSNYYVGNGNDSIKKPEPLDSRHYVIGVDIMIMTSMLNNWGESNNDEKKMIEYSIKEYLQEYIRNYSEYDLSEEERKAGEFLCNAKYNLELVWKIDRDIMLYPLPRWEDEENVWLREKNNNESYRINTELYPCSAKYEKFTWNDVIRNYKNWPEGNYVTCWKSIDDFVDGLKRAFKRYWKVESNNGAHVYLSLGKFDKDYLIV